MFMVKLCLFQAISDEQGKRREEQKPTWAQNLLMRLPSSRWLSAMWQIVFSVFTQCPFHQRDGVGKDEQDEVSKIRLIFGP